jgi:predicted RNase H-like HicB family nuclease
MICEKCKLPIEIGDGFYRGQFGPYHFQCPLSPDQQRIAELERQLAETERLAEWTPITAENLPKVGEQVEVFTEDGEVLRCHLEHEELADDDMREPKWYWWSDYADQEIPCVTHYRALSAPSPAQESEAEESLSRHGHCPACAIGQSSERGEGTHLEGTIEHPSEAVDSEQWTADSSKSPGFVTVSCQLPAVSCKDIAHYMNKKYRVTLEPDGDGDWMASNPDLPGCFADGASEQEALLSLEISRRLWIESRLACGLEVPEPSLDTQKKESSSAS